MTEIGAVSASWNRSHLHLPAWPLALFTLWDFYVGGIRPFDHVAVIVLLIAVWAQMDKSFNVERALKFLPLFAMMWLVVMFSAFRNPSFWKPAIGVLEGCIVAMIIASGRWRREQLVNLMRVVIIVHAVACIFQFAVFIAFHYQLNYQAWFGRPLRTEVIFGMRPAGLFLEPAGFSLMMFSLLCLYRIVGGTSTKLELTGLGTMLLSVSLWGWGAVLIYLLTFRTRWALMISPIILAVFVYIGYKIVADPLKSNLILWVIVRRVLHPGVDNSSQTRYGGLFTSHSVWDWNLWFGEGLKDSYGVYGNNGLSFLLVFGGLTGFVTVVTLWWLILPWGRKVQGVLALGFMLSAATQWTFCWWWAWLAIAASADDRPPSYRRQTIGLSNFQLPRIKMAGEQVTGPHEVVRL